METYGGCACKLTAKLHHFLANNVWRARKQQQAAGDTLEEDEAARGITRISYASKKKKKVHRPCTPLPLL